MKKIISVCLCICLMSGCGKSLNHGRPANDVAEDTGSEAPPPLPSGTSNASAPEPSNTPAPTPESSKSAPPSDSADTGSSVGKYAVNTVLCVVALAVIVGGYDLFRYFNPIEVTIPVSNPVSDMDFSYYKSNFLAYGRCYRDSKDIISYTWHFGILLAKKEILKRCFWIDKQDKEIDSKITVYELCKDNRKFNSYVYKLET